MTSFYLLECGFLNPYDVFLITIGLIRFMEGQPVTSVQKALEPEIERVEANFAKRVRKANPNAEIIRDKGDKRSSAVFCTSLASQQEGQNNPELQCSSSRELTVVIGGFPSANQLAVEVVESVNEAAKTESIPECEVNGQAFLALTLHGMTNPGEFARIIEQLKKEGKIAEDCEITLIPISFGAMVAQKLLDNGEIVLGNQKDDQEAASLPEDEQSRGFSPVRISEVLAISPLAAPYTIPDLDKFLIAWPPVRIGLHTQLEKVKSWLLHTVPLFEAMLSPIDAKAMEITSRDELHRAILMMHNRFTATETPNPTLLQNAVTTIVRNPSDQVVIPEPDTQQPTTYHPNEFGLNFPGSIYRYHFGPDVIKELVRRAFMNPNGNSRT